MRTTALRWKGVSKRRMSVGTCQRQACAVASTEIVEAGGSEIIRDREERLLLSGLSGHEKGVRALDLSPMV